MRIASLLPAATEIVVALGLDDLLVAVTFECAAPARARCAVVVDTAIPVDLAPAQIDAWVRERADRGLPLYELDRAALAAAKPTSSSPRTSAGSARCPRWRWTRPAG